jgi:hypothetical protein
MKVSMGQAGTVSDEPRASSSELRSDDDEFAQLAAGRRKSLMIGAASLVGIIGILGALWWTTRPLIPPLPRERVQKIEEALPMLRKEVGASRALAATALVELEEGRLPPAMLAALRKFPAAPPSMAGMICAESIASPELLELFVAACPDGPAGMSNAISSGSSAPLTAVCGDALQGLMSADEAAGAPAACVALSATVWAYLGRKRSREGIEREFLRMLALER